MGDVADDELAEEDSGVVSREEVSSLLDKLAPSDKRRLAAYARSLSYCGTSWQDLLQEAYLRALDTRTLRLGVGIMPFLCQTMRSIASEPVRERKRAREKAGLEVVYRGTFGDAGLADPVDGSVSPEDASLSTVIQSRRLERVATAIAEDEQLQFLVEGLVERLRGRDLEELVGVDTKGLAAARKRLMRRLLAELPEGSGL